MHSTYEINCTDEYRPPSARHYDRHSRYGNEQDSLELNDETSETMKGAIEDHCQPAIHGLDSKRFSPDLLHRLRTPIERSGYCIFGVTEMERLLSVAKSSHTAKMQVLQEFAKLCGVEVKTTRHFKSAYFHKAV